MRDLVVRLFGSSYWEMVLKDLWGDEVRSLVVSWFERFVVR